MFTHYVTFIVSIQNYTLKKCKFLGKISYNYCRVSKSPKYIRDKSLAGRDSNVFFETTSYNRRIDDQKIYNLIFYK